MVRALVILWLALLPGTGAAAGGGEGSGGVEPGPNLVLEDIPAIPGALDRSETGDSDRGQGARTGGTVWTLLARDEGHGFVKKRNRDFLSLVTTLFLQRHLLAGGRTR